MKALVVGGGSIGKRHLENLKTLGIDALALVEVESAKRGSLASQLGTVAFSDLEDGLAWCPEFVVVATPTHLHINQALQVAHRGIPLFVEKPLSHTATGLAELSEVVDRKKLVSMMGCNLRFHPGPARVQELLQQGLIGAVLFARLQTGSYLPSWRPQTDYRDNYAAREETGGGCILDCIHEIDLARWYLGEVQDVFCMSGHLSSLEIHTEDVAALTCRHASGAISEIHMDYVQRTYERGCQIVGERGTILWDFNAQQVRRFDSANGQWESSVQPKDWALNQMYVDEMKHFVDCVRNGNPSILTISEAVSVMQVALSAKISAREGRLIATGREVLA